MAIVELKDVIFRYPSGFQAINGISLSIEKGEKVAIIGENGAGKTTLAKMMNGLNRPSEGEVLINGKPTKDRTIANMSQDVAYVFQNPDDQICNRTLFSEITFTLKYNKECDEEEIKRRAKEVLKLVGMEGMEEVNPYDLSLAHRKLVTICSAVLQRPDAILLDEPTAGQDPHCLRIIENLIDHLHSKGITMVTITHDMDFVVRNFDRVVVLAHGNVIADSSPREIFWNKEVLEEAALHQPSISQLARKIGMPGNVLNVEEFTEEFVKGKR